MATATATAASTHGSDAAKRAEISAAFDALHADYWEPSDDEVYVAFTFGECEANTLGVLPSGEECDCWDWEWSDLFHAQAAFSGPREEVEAWMLDNDTCGVEWCQSCHGSAPELVIVDRDEWDAHSSAPLPQRLGASITSL